MRENRLIFFKGNTKEWEEKLLSKPDLVNNELNKSTEAAGKELQYTEEIKGTISKYKNLARKVVKFPLKAAKKTVGATINLALTPVDIAGDVLSIGKDTAKAALDTTVAIASVPLTAAKTAINIPRVIAAVPIKILGTTARGVGYPSRIVKKTRSKVENTIDGFGDRMKDKKNKFKEKVTQRFKTED